MTDNDPSLTASAGRWLRGIALVIGVALLLWMPFEDTGINAVLVFSVLICGWWAVRLLLGFSAGRERLVWRHMVVAALAGLAVSPLALLLMALKTGLHGHPLPDFTVYQLQAVLATTPLWILAGILLGIGSGLWRASHGAPDAHSE